MKKGFTLIEVIVTISIFTIVLIAISSLVTTMYRTHGYAFQQSIAIEEARRGVDTMQKEIRRARQGEDGSYPIEKASEKEFIFYSDIDGDGKTERVRYFIGTINSEIKTENCITDERGGSCSFVFSNFLKGEITFAQVKISLDGDLGRNSEFADIYINGNSYGRICQNGCVDCANTWQGTEVFDITNLAGDNSLEISIEASNQVRPICSFQEEDYSMRAEVVFSFQEEIPGSGHLLKKGITKFDSSTLSYGGEEKIEIVSSYVRNSPPIFEYFDKEGNLIKEDPARLIDTKLMKIFLIVNINPDRTPGDFSLESYTYLRNLK